MLDVPQVPKRPIGPPAWIFTAWGGAIGLGIAAIILIASVLRRFVNRRKDVAGATA